MPEPTTPNSARADWPWWVRFSLWGIRSRSAAWASFSLAVTFGLLCAFLTVAVHRIFAVGMGFFVGALWYRLAISWVDRRNGWK